MKSGFVAVGVVVLALVGIAAFYFIDIDQTQEGRLPDVKVEVEGGQLPEVDVKTGDVNVGQKDVTVKVPEVSVDMKEKSVSVPTISVTPPKDTETQ